MKSRMDAIMLKADWADKHIRDLHFAIGIFHKKHRKDFIGTETDAHTGEKRVKVSKVLEVPPEISLIAADAISKLIPHFEDATIGAVAGNAKVGNRVNLWTRWQALEYITSQNFERRALDLFHVVTVVPGAIGAWRTDAVKRAGCYPVNTVAEDADLTMSLLEQTLRVIRGSLAGIH